MTVDLDSSEIAVVEELHVPDSPGTLTVWVPADAIGIESEARIEGRFEGEGFDRLDLRHSSSDFELSYILPSSQGRAATGTRVNPAMIGFHLWPNLPTGSVTVRLPTGFVGNVGPDFVPSLVGDERLSYRADEFVSDELWGYWFVAFRDAGLTSESIAVGDDTITVAAWADDPDWMQFATQYVAEGVPILADLIGQPWPEEDLHIVESVAPTREGYGGWYDRRESRIELPDSLDLDTLLHELSHAWFNDVTLTDRWMVEGLAEEYASAASLVIHGNRPNPNEPGPPPPTLDGLAQWRSRLFFEDTWDEEFYGYQASFWVIHELRAEIGDDGMRATLSAMNEGRPPYALPTEPARPAPSDWPRFLDMLELHGGSTAAEQLFREYVVGGNSAILDDRREAISLYASVFGEGTVNGVPVGVREAMSNWRFPVAIDRIREAQEHRKDLAALRDRATRLELDLPRFLDALYLDSSPFLLESMAESSRLLDAFEDDDRVSDEDRRNFAAGQFDQIDLDTESTALGQDRSGGGSLGWFWPTLVVLMILLSGLLLASRRGTADS